MAKVTDKIKGGVALVVALLGLLIWGLYDHLKPLPTLKEYLLNSKPIPIMDTHDRDTAIAKKQAMLYRIFSSQSAGSAKVMHYDANKKIATLSLAWDPDVRMFFGPKLIRGMGLKISPQRLKRLFNKESIPFYITATIDYRRLKLMDVVLGKGSEDEVVTPVALEVAPASSQKLLQWKKGKDYCRLSHAMGGGWRMPTLEEIQYLYWRKDLYGIDSIFYWSSKQYSEIKDNAWAYNFDIGERALGVVWHYYYVRCVRDRKHP